jgi:hypothetical protein
MARARADLLKARELQKIELLDDLLSDLNDEITMVDALIGEDRQL